MHLFVCLNFFFCYFVLRNIYFQFVFHLSRWIEWKENNTHSTAIIKKKNTTNFDSLFPHCCFSPERAVVALNVTYVLNESRVCLFCQSPTIASRSLSLSLFLSVVLAHTFGYPAFVVCRSVYICENADCIVEERQTRKENNMYEHCEEDEVKEEKNDLKLKPK